MEVAVKAVERRSLLHLASRTNRSSTCHAADSLCKVILLIVRFVLVRAYSFDLSLPLFRGHSRDREMNTFDESGIL